MNDGIENCLCSGLWVAVHVVAEPTTQYELCVGGDVYVQVMMRGCMVLHHLLLGIR